jgi:hypothetical protein
MKSTRKHELQANALAEAMTEWGTWAKAHSTALGYGLLGIVVVIVVAVLLLGAGHRAAANPAADAFVAAESSPGTQGLRGFLKEYPTVPQAQAARLLLADRILADVVRGEAPGGATGVLSEARDLYTQVAQGSPALAPLAKVGLALTTLQEGNLDAGRRELQEVITTCPDSAAAAKAKANLGALADYKPIEFTSEPADNPKEGAKSEAKSETKTEAKPDEAAKPGSATVKPGETLTPASSAKP